jgi:tetratricopeptide (TPR) repeat protein
MLLAICAFSLRLCTGDVLDEESYLNTYKQVAQYTGPFPEYEGKDVDKATWWREQLVTAEGLMRNSSSYEAVQLYQQIFSACCGTLRQIKDCQMNNEAGMLLRLGFGKALMGARLFEPAEIIYQEALILSQTGDMALEASYEPFFHLGFIYAQRGMIPEAIMYYKNAIFVETQNETAYFNLGALLVIEGQINEGMHYYRTALDHHNLNVHNLLNVLDREANLPPLQPEDVTAWMIQLIMTSLTYQTPALTAREFQNLDKFLADPEAMFDRHMNRVLSVMLSEQGLPEQGLAFLQPALRETQELMSAGADPSMNNWIERVCHALTFPIVSPSHQHHHNRESAHTAALSQLEARIDSLLAVTQTAGFGSGGAYLHTLRLSFGSVPIIPLQGVQGSYILAKVGLLYRRSCAALGFVATRRYLARQGDAPFIEADVGKKRRESMLTKDTSGRKYTVSKSHLLTEEKKRRATVRVGFVSRYFREHETCTLFSALLAGLPRGEGNMSVVALGFPSPMDKWSEQVMQLADSRVNLVYNTSESMRRIVRAQLDVLVFLDLPLDSWTYFLAFGRLAAVQVMWLFDI